MRGEVTCAYPIHRRATRRLPEMSRIHRTHLVVDRRQGCARGLPALWERRGSDRISRSQPRTGLERMPPQEGISSYYMDTADSNLSCVLVNAKIVHPTVFSSAQARGTVSLVTDQSREIARAPQSCKISYVACDRLRVRTSVRRKCDSM